MTLHFVMAPDQQILDKITPLLSDADTLILLADGAYLTHAAENRKLPFRVREKDLTARGLTATAECRRASCVAPRQGGQFHPRSSR